MTDPIVIPADGIHSLSARDYHAINLPSPSRLHDLERSPAYCKWRIDNPTDDSTPDRLRGEAVHCLVREPDTFAARFVLKDYDGRTKDGKARKAEVEARGLIPLDVETWDAAHRSADAVRLHPVAKRILDACPNHERSVIATVDGIRMKGRPDAYGAGIILDLKSTKDALEGDFPRFVVKSRVDRQLASYSVCVEASGFPICGGCDWPEAYAVTVMPDAPHEVRVYEFDEATMCDAWDAASNLLRLYRACEESGAWPSKGDEVIPFVRPAWDKAGSPVPIEQMIL